MEGEQRLWIAVIENAFVDAFRRVKKDYKTNKKTDAINHTEEYMIRKRARNFLTFDRPNFRRVCAYAGLNPKWVMRKYVELLDGDLTESDLSRLTTLKRINSSYGRKTVTKVLRADELRKLINGNVDQSKSSWKRTAEMVPKV